MAVGYKLDVEKIKKLALQRGMSISGLCESIGMSRNRATEWKKRTVHPKTVFTVSEALGVKPDELIVEEI